MRSKPALVFLVAAEALVSILIMLDSALEVLDGGKKLSGFVSFNPNYAG